MPGRLRWLGLRLSVELRQWRRLGRRPRIWWRDDDACAATPELDRLLRAAGPRPLALAVVPSGDLQSLADRLAGSPQVTIGQHGVDHHERSRSDGRPSEHPAGADASLDDLIAAIATGRRRLMEADLPPAFYTPPWNAGERRLPQALQACGFDTLSAGRQGPKDSGLNYVATDVDILRWKGGAAFRGRGPCLSALARALETRRRLGRFDDPVGLLTHHLVCSPQAWAFLDRLTPTLDELFDWTSPFPKRREAPGSAEASGGWRLLPPPLAV